MSVTTLTTQSAPTADLFVGTRWEIDSSHSTIGFSVRHLMVSEVAGTFGSFHGHMIQGAEDMSASSLEVTIDTPSITTHAADRDAHLKGPDFFNVEIHPTAMFVSTAFRRIRGENYAIDGNLTIRGITKPITLQAVYFGRMKDGWGNLKAGFSATTTINRYDFDLKWNMGLETGGVLVSEKVKLTIGAQLVWKG
jgi:polyisoprenoid-binding protein YceI